MGETRTYDGLTPGEYAGNMGGSERILVIEGKTVETSDPAEMEFIEGVLGREPKKVESDSPGDGTFDSLSVSDLREELAKRGFGTDGNKAELVARLSANERGELAPPQEGE